MKDAPDCEKCGQIFPFIPYNQQQLRWKHKCPGSAESSKHVAKVAPPVVKRKAPAQPTQSVFTGSSTMGRSTESDTETAATDAPKCEKCGRTFPWNQLHLRWKHKCEPTEATHAPDHPQRQPQSSAAADNMCIRRPVPIARTKNLPTFNTGELGVVNETDSAPLVCGCGKTFTDDQGKNFVKHQLECPEGAPLSPLGGPLSPTVAGRRARGATLKL